MPSIHDAEMAFGVYIIAFCRCILGSVDAMKVKSCMTLFWRATGDELFRQVLDKYYGGAACEQTLRLIG